MSSMVQDLKRHYEDGLILDDGLLLSDKVTLMKDRDSSPLTKLTWTCNSREFELKLKVSGGRSLMSLSMLPDASGFICFETGEWKPDNCLLLDAYGKERMRLTVPWQLTRQKNPESAKPPTSFANISEPYTNPDNGEKGNFGVRAWVEHAGDYYFELDYETGQFLWGVEIRF